MDMPNKLPANSTTVWVWSEEESDGFDTAYAAVCDDDGEPVDDRALLWKCSPSAAYEIAERFESRFKLEVIDDMWPEHRAEALALSDW